ncbi:MAG TPA: AMP-binding protein [Capillimicrobium sp.]|nr:AMP-binding protein [Capillimicrobium sp.]
MTGPGPHTVGRWIRDRARATPDRVAIRFAGADTSYAELDARSERLAAGLLRAGLRRGDRVATLTANRPEHVEALFACAKAGLALVPLNWRLAPDELAYAIADAEPAIVLAEAGRAATLDATGARVHGIEREALDALAAPPPGAPAPVADDDPLLIVYTSGTTGRPKGAVLTHANCFWTNLALERTAPIDAGDAVLAVLPQFHVGGWNVQPLLAWWVGATVVLEPAFDAGRVLDLLERERIAHMMGVPATYAMLAEHERFATADLSHLRRAIVGGAPMPEPLLRTWAARGVAIVQGYGLTEAAPNVLCVPPEDAERRIGWAGRPYPHVHVALRDPATGRLLGDGPGAGELVVRGPSVFAGYWRNPEATAAAFADGWLLTGDVAERDADGFYALRGRLKELFISGGENVYPAEVERVLAEHDAIAEAAVVGVPDPRWGEVGAAFVVAAAGRDVDARELLAFAAERLARYKVPRAVRVVADLPRTSLGKVRREALRDAAAAAVEVTIEEPRAG